MIPAFFLLLTQQAASQVAESPLPEATSFVWADVDGDGRLDLAAIRAEGTLQILLNASGGRFEDATEHLGLSVVVDAALLAWADYDADGRLDVFVGARAGASGLYHNEGGAFVDMSAGSGLVSAGPVHSAYWLDHDGDTRLDLVVLTAGEGALAAHLSAKLFRGLEGGFFETSELPALVGAALAGVPTGEVPERGAPADSGPTGSGGGKHGSSLAVPGGSPPGPTVAIGPPPSVGPATPMAPFPIGCSSSVRDQANPGTCLSASTTPTLGMLYPLSLNLFVSPAGNVGMGTLSPLAKLDVRGGLVTSGMVGLDLYEESDGTTARPWLRLGGEFSGEGVLSKRTAGENQWGLDLITAHQPRLSVTNVGRVGIGSSSPLAKLDVLGGADANGANDPVAIALQHRSGGFRHYIRSRHNSVTNDAGNAIEFFLNNTNTSSGSSAPSVGNVLAMGLSATVANRLQVSGGIEVDSNNAGNGSAGGAMLRFGDPSSGEGVLSKRTAGGNQFGLELWTAFQPRLAITSAGNIGVGTQTPTERLDVAGSTRTQCVKITGGCDLAEPFEIDGASIEPGMVVSIDPLQEGKLRPSTKAYDTAVAGVVSGAGGVHTGVSLSQTDMFESGDMVALAGRVYCWCDASGGAIRPGDLLTSSDVSGHAMNATDRERASGAILGKALTRLDEGRGLVLIVVSLQ